MKSYEPAYPVVGSKNSADYSGFTKRERIAIAAMQGLLSQQGGGTFQIHTDQGVLLVPARKAIPQLAVDYADGLIAALEDDA